jgi:hypothetical protein
MTGKGAQCGIDFGKQYASCLYKSKYAFLIFNEFCREETKPDNEDFKFETDCVYYVCKQEQFDNIETPIPIDRHMCADWYYPQLIQYWLEHKMITLGDLRYRIRASETIPVSRFRKFIKFVFENVKCEDSNTSKRIINSFIGCLRQRKSKKTTCNICDDKEQIYYNLNETDTIRELEDDRYMVIKTVERIISSTHIPIHQQILDISQVFNGKLITELENRGCEIVGLKTDCIYVNNYIAREQIKHHYKLTQIEINSIEGP